MSSRYVSLLSAAAAFAAVVAVSQPSAAHFKLGGPPANLEQDSLGNPQKMGPCGDDGTGVATGVVTTYQAGQTITITLDETIFHPGHYRVALAVNDPSELPAEPPVTPGATACGSVEIMDPPVFPVIADGQLVHTDAFAGTQTFEVTLPTDVTCDHCTLQVLEFMSSHGAPCFYHHCADIKIQAEPVMTTTTTTATTSAGTGGSTATGDGGATPAGSGGAANGEGGSGSNLSSTSGCDCSLAAADGASEAGLLAGLGLGLVIAARRRRASRA